MAPPRGQSIMPYKASKTIYILTKKHKKFEAFTDLTMFCLSIHIFSNSPLTMQTIEFLYN